MPGIMIERPADNFDRKESVYVNRTGGTLTLGQIVALDLTGSDGDVDTYAEQLASSTPDPDASPFANVIKVATAHLTGWIFALCLEASIADNARGRFLLYGKGQVSVAAGNGTAAVAVKGDKVMGANTALTVTKLTDAHASLGILTTDGPTAAAAATAHMIFNGYAFGAAGAAS